MSDPSANLKKFPPGISGNPGGKPVHARNRLSKSFLNALADDFETHGKEAIIATREKSPDRYTAIVASLMPKEFLLERPLDGINDDELAVLITYLQSLVGRVADDGAGENAPTQH